MSNLRTKNTIATIINIKKVEEQIRSYNRDSFVETTMKNKTIALKTNLGKKMFEVEMQETLGIIIDLIEAGVGLGIIYFLVISEEIKEKIAGQGQIQDQVLIEKELDAYI